jgi:hypothetical protein
MSLFSFFSKGHHASRKPHRSPKAPGSRTPGSAKLVVEALEDRMLPSATVVSGYVFNDLQNTGIMQPGEPPLANNPIELVNSSNQIAGTTTTDGNGYYQFDHNALISTAPQTITKSLMIPATATNFSLSGMIAQFDPSLGTLQSVTISNAGSITSDIKVENTSTSSPSIISATVSGSLTLNGPSGITVQTNLQQNAGTFNATTFDNQLDFSGSSGKDFGNQTANGTQSLTLTGNSMSPFMGGGNVALTENANASSSASGGGNLVMAVTSSATAQITVTYTYIPDNSLQPGNYTIIELSTPPGYFDGKNSKNGVPLNNPIGYNKIPITVVAGTTTYPNNEFGKLQAASLSGYVYADISSGGYNDGIKEVNELGIAGVTIQLSGPTSLTTTTDANGFYSFTGLQPGTYQVTETHAAGWIDGKDTVGTAGGNMSQNQFSNITLGGGVNGQNYNFGELKVGEISGTVFNDSSPGGFNNGIQDPGEPGLAGVIIHLTGTDVMNNQVSLSTATDGNGNYQFSNLAPGTYAVAKVPPAGWLVGKQAMGTLGGTQLVEQFVNIVMPAGGAGDHYNFAQLVPSTLTGFVYLDTGTGPAYNNGNKDIGEAGLGNVLVTLTGVNDLGAATPQQQLTAADGSYKFEGLRPGTYTVTETHPSGYIDGKDNVGSVGGIVGSDVLFNINLAPNTYAYNYNFAELTPVISDIPPVISPPPGPPLYPPDLISPPTGTPPALPVTTKGQLLASSINLSNPVIQGEVRYINSIYDAVLGRDSGSNEIVPWLLYLNSGGTRAGLVNAIWVSQEHRTREVTMIFQTIVGVTPDQGTINSYLNMFSSGATEMQVSAAIAASSQAFAQFPTTSSYITQLYTVVLGRTPTAGEIAAWAGSGMSRFAIAATILTSQESLGDIVQRSYLTVLGRSPGANEVAMWTTGLQSGLDFGTYEQILLNSGEYIARVGG